MEPLISFRSVSKRYPNGTHALNNISLDIAPGEFISIIGPSGSGKSTLLRLVNHLITATDGEVLVDGQDMACLRGSALRAQRRMKYLRKEHRQRDDDGGDEHLHRYFYGKRRPFFCQYLFQHIFTSSNERFSRPHARACP